MYGYRIKKGEIEIYEPEAEIVRMIFKDYVGGIGSTKIAKKLSEMGIKKLRGGVWNAERVLEILKNEKYTGNALLQKKYVKDHLSKVLVFNKGILPKYYAEGTHPAIIDIETFQKAQEIISNHTERCSKQKEKKYPFAGKIVCGICGKNYKRKVSHGKAY